MSTIYSDVVFTDQKLGGISAVKLNKLKNDLSSAIAAGGGGTGTGDMLKSVYDTNANNVVDTADSIPWGSVTGKPTTFPAALHAATHLDNGSDPVPMVTASRTGLVPILSSDANTFLNGSGTWSTPQTLTQAQWNYRNILTMADPGSGNLRFDNAIAGSATQIVISKITANNVDRYNLLKSLQVGDTIQAQDTTASANWIRYRLTAVPTDNASWFLLPIATVTGSGTTPGNNDLLTLSFSIAGGGAPTGDMLKNVYDTNANNVVDTCDSLAYSKLTGTPTSFTPSAHASTHLAAGSDPIALATSVLAGLCPAVDNITIQVVTSKLSCVALAWTAITGKPSTFPPDATAMLKSVYDTNADNVVDHAALADTATAANAVPWTGVTGKPATFPPDSTAMLRSVYDTNSNNIVDTCDSLAWGKLTGVPATFPPDSTAMLKSVYDTNANNKVDSAESADAAPWTGITGKPASFTPSAHASTHLDNGSDSISVVTTSRTGLAPVLSGNAATYLNGTGTFSAVSGSVNPGTWTTLSLGTGWTAPTQAQYRVEVNGAVSTVYFRGMIQGAYSVIGTTAFTVPAGGQPSMSRRAVLAGAQNTGTATDVASYVADVSSAGVCTIYALTAGPFVWYDPAQTQQVYLDGLSYSL
jgi:hypothetical protein